jgi:PKD repeat protein
MKKLSLLSTLLLFLAGLLHAQTPNNAPKPTYKTNQVLLKLSSGVDKWQHEATILDILAAQAGKITPIYGTDVQLVYLPDVVVIDGQSLNNPQQIADYFSRHPHPYLDYIEPNYLYSIATTPNDPHFDDQWGLQQANDRDIDAPEAWDMNHDCNDVVVGLLDSGIDWRHPDLIDNIWQNLGEDADNDGHVLELISGVWQFDPGDINNTDNDGNGYKDDFIGWDFANNDNNPMDDNGHGTHCGGIIGARGNNGIGVTGVCWNVKIMALKFLGSDGGGATSDATAALNYAVAKQATLTNNSWGGTGSSVALQNAIANAQTHNQLFVTSSGNDSKNIDTAPFYPANYSSNNIIVVAASTPSDNLAGFSNYGQANVDVLAPGVDIYSTQLNNTYGYESGTSQATAFVTGAAALAYCNNTTYTNLKNTLLSGIDTKLSMGTQCATGGRINVFKARSNANCCTAAASFTASASTNCLGNLISFTNTSTNASTYQWTIDGMVQPYSNTISYYFTTGGEHTVALLASNGTCTDAAYQTLNTSDALTANFTHYENGLTAACFAPLSNNTYQWNFGDGATSTNNNAVHTYTIAGTYNVCLTASNVCDTLQTCQSITVAVITDCGDPTPGIEWQNTIGDNDSYVLNIVRQTADGGYILGGYSSSGIFYDYWIVKLDAEGQIQTQRTIGGSGDDYLTDIQQTADGGYVVGGYSNSGISGDKTQANKGGGDYWVVKITATGSIQWQNTIGGNSYDGLQSIQQTTDGGYILGGYSNSGISGDKTEASQGYGDYWVVKLTATGAIQWQNTIGGNSSDVLQSIQQTTDGGYILGGYSDSDISGDKTEENWGGFDDYWVVKLTANGAIEWQNTIGGSSLDYLQSIQQTTDGGYILGGYSNSGISGDKTEASQGDYDYWVVKLTTTGTIQWQNTIGGSGDDQLQSIQQTTDGGYILGGYSDSGIGGDKTEANYIQYPINSDYWVIKLSSSGVIQWQNTIGEFYNDILRNIQQTTDGGYILGGHSQSDTNGESNSVIKIAPSNVNMLSVSFNTPLYQCLNVPTSFNNISTGASAYQWLVDNILVTNEKDLEYTFDVLGSHSVTLIGSDGVCRDTITQVSNIQNAPTYTYTLSQLSATFTASTSGNTWDFGDGTIVTSAGSYVTHTYTANGIYTVCLSNNSCEVCKNIAIIAIVDLPLCPTIEWQNTIGGSSSDELQSIQQTTDGGYILGGYSQSGISGDKTEACQGNYDYWVVKLSATGTIEWQNTIGGSSNDELQSIQQTTDGGYILGGYSQSGISGDKTEASQGSGYTDYWVVKLSAIGTIEWQNTIGGNRDDMLQSIQQTADGGYILGGYSKSGISGDKTEAYQSSGYYDYWVIKLSAIGTIEWQNTIGGSNNDYLQSIQQTTDGGYILSGYSYSGISGDKTEVSQGGSDYWVVKLSATGTIEWQNTIGGSSTDYLQSIKQTTDGGYILGGSSNSGISGDKTEANQGSSSYYDYWVVKLSTTGAIEWQNTIGGSSSDYLQSIQQTTDGGYILGGYSASGISGDKTEASQGNSDYWVVKLSATGTIEWQNTIGGSSLDYLQSIQQTTDGGYILGGYSYSGISGDKTEASQGNYDYWVIKMEPSTHPIATFNTSYNNAITYCINDTIIFNNLSLNATAYQWLVDGFVVSNDTNFSYAGGTIGTHTVTLIAHNGDCKSTMSKTVSILNIKDFSHESNGLMVTFSTQAGATNYTWDFGDGTTGTGQNSTHTYSLAGTYTACLTANYICQPICDSITISNTINCLNSPPIEWQNTIGGNSEDYLTDIQQTTDGGYILGGYSASGISGDKTEANQSSSSSYFDYWIVKLAANGTIEWQNTIGGGNNDLLQSIQQTTDGGYILGGYSTSGISGDKTEANQGSSLYYDYWVVKISATGTLEWQNTIGGSSSDYLQSIQQTTDGGYILGGYSASGISGDKTETSQGSYDYWVVKLTATGTIEWQNTIGGSGEDQLQSIQQTTDGGYILGGYSQSGISGDKTEANQGFSSYYDYWVVRLTASGTIQWQNTIGGSNNDYLQSIQQTTDDGYILGGYSRSGISGDKTEASQGFSDHYWVIKLSATGIIQWQNTIGGSGSGGSSDQLQSIQQTTDGGYILGGYSSNGISGDKTEASQGSYDYWVIKLAATGTLEWQNTIGGSGEDQLQSIQQTTDGGYILGGYSQSGISGDKTETSQGYNNYWVVKLPSFTYIKALFSIPYEVMYKNAPVTIINTSGCSPNCRIEKISKLFG